jgi:rSAM/selenodomain-associated transferase 2
MISVVIPALNAGQTLGPSLASLARARADGFVAEVLVVDGGSIDDTVAIAEAGRARLVRSARGRGVQLCAGAAEAREGWLLFLHADTRLSDDWHAAAAAFAGDPANVMRAAVFDLAFDSAAPAARRVERMVAWRTRALGLPYGDQGLLISAAFLKAIGGYRPLVLMEDADLMRRIGRQRLDVLPARAVTSARRYERDGWLARPVRNLMCLALWRLGVPPAAIARLYG